MVINYKTFIANVIVENLHPELQDIIKSDSRVSKQTLLASKIRDLASRGEATGIEGNMPKGSSRAYMQHSTPDHIVVDGHPTTMKTGTKVAIKSNLDRYHDHASHDGKSLGEMQNDAENNDHWVNSTYRTLTHEGGNKFTTNHEGIFPPLLAHDSEGNKWSHIGHAPDISKPKFKELTKTEGWPNGISHDDFHSSMMRFHNRNNGKHWDSREDKHLDKIDQHPLVQSFQDYHGNTGNSPVDLGQIKNMGVWKHPVTGKEQIVARDHGFDNNVAEAYRSATKKRYK